MCLLSLLESSKLEESLEMAIALSNVIVHDASFYFRYQASEGFGYILASLRETGHRLYDKMQKELTRIALSVLINIFDVTYRKVFCRESVIFVLKMRCR